jgi:arylsulfatase A-like enzyme
MKHLSFNLVAGLALCSVATACAGNRAKNESKRPNILFIMSDDHAYQALSAYSDHLIRTPNIDRIARDGMIFRNSCVTNSISAPSRAVLLTGKHTHINGKINNIQPFDTSQVTFPRLLQAAGYETGLFGKLHFGNEPKGFNQYKILPDQGVYYNPDFITKDSGMVQYPGYVTDIITDMSLNWLEKGRDKSKPFLLMYLHKAPHREWFPALRHIDEYTNRSFVEPATLFDNYEGRGTAAKTAEMNILTHMNWAGDSKVYPELMDKLGIAETANWDKAAFHKEYGRMTPEQKTAWDKVYGKVMADFEKRYPNMTEKEKMQWRYQRYMQDYCGTIAAIDEGVGKILDYLEKNGLSENTIVVYTSDQGFYLGEHGWFDKRFVYDESFKTPLLIQWPTTIKAGSVNTNMVQNLDMAPTLLTAAGVKVPGDMQGESMIPLFKGGKKFRDAAYYQYYEYPGIHAVKRHYAIVTEAYKLIHFYHDINEWELYDRKKDPQEMKNVYNDPAYSSIRKKLHAELIALRKKYKDSDALDRYYIEIEKEDYKPEKHNGMKN